MDHYVAVGHIGIATRVLCGDIVGLVSTHFTFIFRWQRSWRPSSRMFCRNSSTDFPSWFARDELDLASGRCEKSESWVGCLWANWPQVPISSCCTLWFPLQFFCLLALFRPTCQIRDPPDSKLWWNHVECRVRPECRQCRAVRAKAPPKLDEDPALCQIQSSVLKACLLSNVYEWIRIVSPSSGVFLPHTCVKNTLDISQWIVSGKFPKSNMEMEHDFSSSSVWFSGCMSVSQGAKCHLISAPQAQQDVLMPRAKTFAHRRAQQCRKRQRAKGAGTWIASWNFIFAYNTLYIFYCVAWSMVRKTRMHLCIFNGWIKEIVAWVHILVRSC